MKNLISDFKKFAFKGNVFDMAIGVVIGAAFSKIVSSFVADIITPLISLITREGTPIKDKFVVLADTKGQVFETAQAAAEAGFPTLNYGIFIQNVIDFFIIAVSVYIAVRLINRSKEKLEYAIQLVKDKEKKEEEEKAAQAPPPAPTTKECPYCMSEISIRAVRCPNCTSVLTEENKE